MGANKQAGVKVTTCCISTTLLPILQPNNNLERTEGVDSERNSARQAVQSSYRLACVRFSALVIVDAQGTCLHHSPIKELFRMTQNRSVTCEYYMHTILSFYQPSKPFNPGATSSVSTPSNSPRKLHIVEG